MTELKCDVKDMALAEQITLIFDDIFNVDSNDKYDLIFIDAAKAQYVKFFNKSFNNPIIFGPYLAFIFYTFSRLTNTSKCSILYITIEKIFSLMVLNRKRECTKGIK